MRALLFCTCLLIAVPTAAKDRQVIQPLPREYLAQLNIVGVDVSLREPAFGSVNRLDDRASNKFDRQNSATGNAPPPQSRKSYATMPTVVMISELMADRMQGWNFTKGREVRLKVSLDTVKLASEPHMLIGLPRDGTVLGLAERDRFLGSNDEIGGIVDVVDVADQRRLGSFYIDVVHHYAGPFDLAFRGRSIREKLAESFSLAAARCLSSPKCKRTKGIEL
jgi:hypothetical protein